MEALRIGEIWNYYGGLYIKQYEDKYYWIIEDYSTDFDSLIDWIEIPQDLYDCLLNYENNRIK